MIHLVGYGETFIFLALGFASVLALAVGIERSIVFNRNTAKKTEEFMNNLALRLRSCDTAGALDLAHAESDHVYSRFASFSLQHFNEAHDGLSDLMAGQMVKEKLELEKRLIVLNTLGNNAPFIGLLGTVLGVIKAFHGLGTLGNTGAEVVMRSISSALLATAAGLFVAIPVVMANNYFSRKLKIIMQNLEVLAREFMASHAHRKAGGRCKGREA
jgi:biopolymer transport protein ExbB